MDLKLTDKVAVVSGASKGIGLAIVKRFAEEGAKVIAISRSLTEELDLLIQNHQVKHLAIDVNTARDTDELSQKLVEAFGRIDILINNVGAIDQRRGQGFLATPSEEWEQLYNLNLFSVVRLTQAALPHIIEQNSGSIVNISSINAQMPELLLPIYGTTKAALNNLTKMLAGEFGPRQIRVNSISPGPVVTPLWNHSESGLAKSVGAAAGMTSEDIMEKLPAMAGITLGRFAQPEDIANLTVFLASEQASMITGSDYVIDGNLLKTI
ncbi:NAD(P)-dependent dehydrogenase, short-chain alcohol dehydrogenase family [Paenibacillus sophorae]|uniref:NAD(P)-dependent dehydrogenase, short-chain alcohol dehydrogenase family n=1 Tax=Paenibacillus sophorae TaxID=1333845 RepID=A0A1H8MN51_9BACL|nr:oxidoreductase [Paenibacillus sophorae]QWU17877.1 SDR family oxidoreductase [Paenibacillus sophorae]SEO18688.1 NAD(P)-dependent dehydrogenase, short-chain alcohol dehydrogenase family [Paenibacillus sophorae]